MEGIIAAEMIFGLNHFAQGRMVLTMNRSATESFLDPRRWRILAVLAVAQFMVVLDATIVNVALPSIRADLGFDATDLQWVVNAYTLLFGGFLLLGGRLGDLLGRRRVFLTGLGLFAVASLAGGFATSQDLLVGARAVQGFGAALMSPAALALVVTTFPAGRERATAMGIWASLAGLGGTVGVVAGGILVDAVGWEWVFFVNVPVAIAVVPFVLRLVRESREEVVGRRTYDVAGAVTATLGLMTLVYAVIGTDQHGWVSARTLGLVAGSVALLGTFVAIESRSSAPLVPLRLFANRGVSTGNVAQLLNGAAFIGMFFLLALAMQSVLGMSAIETGIAFVPMGVTAIAGATLAPVVVARYGTRVTFAIGALLGFLSLGFLSQMDASVSYAAHVLPAIMVYGFAIPFMGVPNTIAAIRDVPAARAGTASGLVNASFQVGGAIGVAAVTALATSHTTALLAGGSSQAEALAAGYARGFAATAIVAGLALVLALVASPSLRVDAEETIEAEADMVAVPA
jgi:EmrB/QacA subfamily drug resistance transporter